MPQYYYAAAALPMLFFDSPPGMMDAETFLSFCSDWLSDADYQQLNQSKISVATLPVDPHPVVKKWFHWECSLRNELVLLRAAEKGSDPYTHLKEDVPHFLGMTELAREAVSESSPLAAEETLNRGRWRFLEELETGHFFDIDFMIVYYLKLQLLERRSLFEKQAGRERYEKIFERITDYDVQELLLAQK